MTYNNLANNPRVDFVAKVLYDNDTELSIYNINDMNVSIIIQDDNNMWRDNGTLDIGYIHKSDIIEKLARAGAPYTAIKEIEYST